MGVAAAQSPDAVDPTIYCEEDDVGEHEIQRYIVELLRPLVEEWVRTRGMEAHVGADQYIYYRQYDPKACVAPDLYVLPGVPQEIAIGVWKVWERGVVPSFALEVVGTDAKKDYDQTPARYADLGVTELIVFDPFAGEERRAFAVYRRRDGKLLEVETTDADRVWSECLGCFVRRVGEGAAMRLRLGVGDGGERLFPTREEAERAAKEAERAAKEAERAGKEAERAARERAEAELAAAQQRIAELEAELLRRG